LRFDDAWKRSALAFVQLGVAFDLKRCRRHAALTSHGIGWRHAGPRERGARGGGPGGSEGRLAPGRWESVHLFGQIPSFGAVRRAAGPQLRTHSPGGAVDR